MTETPGRPAHPVLVEAIRRALLRTRARIRYLEARQVQAPLAPRAAARLDELQAEEATLWRELRRVAREEVLPEDGGPDPDPDPDRRKGIMGGPGGACRK